MLAEKGVAQTFAGEKTGRGALDAKLFEFLAALALEFIFGERCVAREIGHQIEKAGGKFREAGNGNGAGIRTSVSAETASHAAQIFFDAAAGARFGSRANDRGRDIREARSGLRDHRISAAEIELRGNFRKRARFGEYNLHAIRERADGALGPRDWPFRTESRSQCDWLWSDGSGGHRAAPCSTPWAASC